MHRAWSAPAWHAHPLAARPYLCGAGAPVCVSVRARTGVRARACVCVRVCVRTLRAAGPSELSRIFPPLRGAWILRRASPTEPLAKAAKKWPPSVLQISMMVFAATQASSRELGPELSCRYAGLKACLVREGALWRRRDAGRKTQGFTTIFHSCHPPSNEALSSLPLLSPSLERSGCNEACFQTSITAGKLRP
jgi:hypothetical protein